MKRAGSDVVWVFRLRDEEDVRLARDLRYNQGHEIAEGSPNAACQRSKSVLSRRWQRRKRGPWLSGRIVRHRLLRIESP